MTADLQIPRPPRIAARMREIEPFHVMEIGRRAEALERAGRRIVHMEIGQPDFSAPPQVIEAAVAAVRSEPLGYTAALGTPALRSELGDLIQRARGLWVAAPGVERPAHVTRSLP